MAHFLGEIQGQRGPASRLGSKASRLQVTAASWQGCVKTHLYEKDGKDMARVTLERWRGRGTSRILYEGPVSG